MEKNAHVKSYNYVVVPCVRRLQLGAHRTEGRRNCGHNNDSATEREMSKNEKNKNVERRKLCFKLIIMWFEWVFGVGRMSSASAFLLFSFACQLTDRLSPSFGCCAFFNRNGLFTHEDVTLPFHKNLYTAWECSVKGENTNKQKPNKISISMIAAIFFFFWSSESRLVINPFSGKCAVHFETTKCSRFIIIARKTNHLNKLLILIVCTPQNTVAHRLIYQKVTRSEQREKNPNKYCKRNRPHRLHKLSEMDVP